MTPPYTRCANRSARRSTSNRSALGPDADSRTVSALEMSYFSALVQAGSGFFTYRHLADRLGCLVRLIVKEPYDGP